jgi:hypothetical protein
MIRTNVAFLEAFHEPIFFVGVPNGCNRNNTSPNNNYRVLSSRVYQHRRLLQDVAVSVYSSFQTNGVALRVPADCRIVVTEIILRLSSFAIAELPHEAEALYERRRCNLRCRSRDELRILSRS